MCGIIGIIGNQKDLSIKKLGLWQNHRGPDQWGEYKNLNVNLGHNRLSIIDLELGNQPMTTDDGNYTIVFNGEIYNYAEIKQDLQSEGVVFNTKNSDTEVILLGYQKWGTLIFEKLRGMFAACIYDKRNNQCVLFRDIMGIKPLYFYQSKNRILFASEIKPIINSIKNPVFNIKQLEHYFTNRCTSSSSTFVSGINKVLPGNYIIVDCKTLNLFSKKYSVYRQKKINTNYKSKIKILDKLLEDSVRKHLISDVPVGVFLSGGVDSSLVSFYASKIKKIEAFNLGTDSKWDETKYSKIAADSQGLRLTTKYLSNDNILKYFEKWAYYNDDPVADPSAMALMALSEHTRNNKHKVMLAGEGADELFLGYNIYIKYIIFNFLKYIPDFLLKLLPWNSTQFIDWKKYKSYFGAGHISNYKERKIILDHDMVLNFNQDSYDYHRIFKSKDYENRLPNDLLTRTDRATMAFSIEARVPFLINEIIDFSDSLDFSDLIQITRQKGKKILKDLAETKIPIKLVRRKKRGFEIPIDDWISNKFKKQIDHFLKKKNIPGINYNGIKKIVDINKNHSLIWSWLVLEKWYEIWFLKGIKKPIISKYINKDSYN